MLFVIVQAGLAGGIAGVEPALAGSLAVLDFEQHCEDAETAFGVGRLKETVDAGGGLLADIEVAGGDEAGAVEYADHAAFAGATGGIGAKEGFEGVRDVVGEALFVTLEEGAQFTVDGGGDDVAAQVGVFVQDAALAFGERTGCKVDTQRRDGLQAAVAGGLGAVAKEMPAKMSPA